MEKSIYEIIYCFILIIKSLTKCFNLIKIKYNFYKPNKFKLIYIIIFDTLMLL